MEERTCDHCGCDISRRISSARFCSNECRQGARPRIPCSECGRPSGWTVGRSGVDPAKVRCQCCRKASRLARCEHCEQSFTSRRHSRGGWTRFCSKSCARKAQFADGTHPWIRAGQTHLIVTLTEEERTVRRFIQGERARRKRRARLAEVESEPYTLTQIAERDGFRCGICGRKVNMTLSHPHSRSASIDHIVPLSLGGDDLRTNVRLAHLGENLARGNRGDAEQLLLIG